MVKLQILNKVLEEKSIDFIEKNNLEEKHFLGYEDELNFILDHFDEYGKVPDKTTFLDEFNDFEIFAVNESEKYLLDTLLEEALYSDAVPLIQKSAEILKVDSREAIEYLKRQLGALEISNTTDAVDIIKQADKRLDLYNEKMNAETPWYIPTGLQELDEYLNGWARGEDYIVIFARTGQGKSWLLAKTLMHAWQVGFRVGYISPEMSADRIGYRFDTLYKNFSNKNLVWGEEEKGYSEYIKDLKKKDNPFVVSTPIDFKRKITVGKIKQYILKHKLDVLGIDGITYMTDERAKRGDNKTTTLTNISEDLMSLSLELKIPIIIVVQSNREGVRDGKDGTPDLENIRDSDGIAQNATKVLSLRQTGAGLEIGIKKHRDGRDGGKLLYFWDIDKGIFRYIPADDDATDNESREEKKKELRASFSDATDVF